MKHSKTEIALLTISVVFVVVMLIVPLVSVLTNSLAEGWDFYVQALTTPYVLSALRLTLPTSSSILSSASVRPGLFPNSTSGASIS